MYRHDRLLGMYVAALLFLVADSRIVPAEPEPNADVATPAVKSSSLLTEKDTLLVQRLVKSFKDVEGNANLLLGGDVRVLLPDSLRAALSQKEEPTPRTHLQGEAEERHEGLFPHFDDGFRQETATLASCVLWKATKNGKYSRKVDYSVERVRTALLGRTSEEWAERREDCSKTPEIQATMWIRFDDEGTPYIGEEIGPHEDLGLPAYFSTEAEARFVFGDAAAFRRGETVRLELTEESMAELREKSEALLSERIREQFVEEMGENGLDKELMLPMLRAIWDRFVNDDTFANRECVLVCERGVTMFSVTVPKKD
jgi:hypothetical protein